MSDPELKRNAFDEVLPSRIDHEQNGVGLLAAIYESNDVNLIRSLPRLPSMSGSRIGPNEAYMFGSILSRRGNVQEKVIDFYDCGLNDEHVNTIVQNLNGFRIRVCSLSCRIVFVILIANPLKP